MAPSAQAGLVLPAVRAVPVLLAVPVLPAVPVGPPVRTVQPVPVVPAMPVLPPADTPRVVLAVPLVSAVRGLRVVPMRSAARLGPAMRIRPAILVGLGGRVQADRGGLGGGGGRPPAGPGG